jgi:hypothetical protein
LVQSEGLEGALQGLFREGVYLTVDEFKGRHPVVRGSLRFDLAPTMLRSRAPVTAVGNQSSGSRGAPTLAPFGMAHLRNRAAAYCAEFGARGGLGWVKGIWDLPGSAVANVLRFSGFGEPIARWFALVPAATPGLDPRYRWAERAVHWGSLLAGRPLPEPEAISMDAPLRIADWMASVLRGGQAPHLYGFVSPAVRLCLAAERAGLDLRGARLTLTGEPLTPARAATFARLGVQAMSRYGSAEAGSMAASCEQPSWSDEHHVLAYGVALVQPGAAGAQAGLPDDALLVSSLRPEAPFTLLNFSTGDRATRLRRDCGCPLERLGWSTHLHTLRSFEKLIAAGMTFLDVRVIPILEEVLPARFGGGPTHYQLVESETRDGQALLRLLVDPSLGRLDEGALREAFLQAVAAGSGAERAMVEVWRTRELLRIERRPPLTTPGGKILHVHRERPGAGDERTGEPAVLDPTAR